jgi:hypothetical protein
VNHLQHLATPSRCQQALRLLHKDPTLQGIALDYSAAYKARRRAFVRRFTRREAAALHSHWSRLPYPIRRQYLAYHNELVRDASELIGFDEARDVELVVYTARAEPEVAGQVNSAFEGTFAHIRNEVRTPARFHRGPDPCSAGSSILHSETFGPGTVGGLVTHTPTGATWAMTASHVVGFANKSARVVITPPSRGLLSEVARRARSWLGPPTVANAGIVEVSAAPGSSPSKEVSEPSDIDSALLAPDFGTERGFAPAVAQGGVLQGEAVWFDGATSGRVFAYVGASLLAFQLGKEKNLYPYTNLFELLFLEDGPRRSPSSAGDSGAWIHRIGTGGLKTDGWFGSVLGGDHLRTLATYASRTMDYWSRRGFELSSGNP